MLVAAGGALKERAKRTRVHALMRRPGAGCPGEDRNGALARSLDADPALREDVVEILDIPFPTLGVDERAWAPAPLTGEARWVSASALAKTFASAALERESASLEARLAPLEARISGGDASAVAEAAEARAAYESALATVGAGLLEAATQAPDKAGAGDVGVCPNAASFGGCAGEDATRVVLRTVAEDKRFTKVAAGL